ncbi:MAG: putative lipoprotein [Myxococcaceae bacterium]|nr:putative lipoprotein [Myxococcaceae bacterium]
MSVGVRMACTILSMVAGAGCALSPALDEQTESTSTDAGADDLSDSDARVAAGHKDASSPKSDAGTMAAATGSVAADAALSTLGSTSAAPSDAGVVQAAAPAVSDAAVSEPVAAKPSEALVAAPAGASTSCAVPAEAALEDVSHPTTVVGTGTPASCTSSAFVAAVAAGGVITFNCGASPTTITLDATAKVFNDKATKLVIDGGNKVTLSGGGKVRILYLNTCDQSQVWTSPHCDNQEFPQLTVQNLTFANGNAKSEKDPKGGAIYASGGRLKIINSKFVSNVCADAGPDVAGGAVHAQQPYNNLPAYVVGSVFGGQDGSGNVCSNGGALSGMGVSFNLLNSTLSYNKAIGNGANPAAEGTPGGGSGGAIYANGNAYTLSVCGSTLEHNRANEGGGSIFFVSNDRTGSVSIASSTLTDNVSGKFENYTGMFVQASGAPSIVNSTVSK